VDLPQARELGHGVALVLGVAPHRRGDLVVELGHDRREGGLRVEQPEDARDRHEQTVGVAAREERELPIDELDEERRAGRERHAARLGVGAGLARLGRGRVSGLHGAQVSGSGAPE